MTSTRKISVVAAAAMLVLAATTSHAQVLRQIDVDALPGGVMPTTGKMQWNGVNSSLRNTCLGATFNLAPSGTQGACVGPYSAKFNLLGGSTVTGPAYDIFCVDFLHAAKTSGTQSVNFTSVATGNLAKTRLGNVAGAQLKYQKAAWLADQFTSANYSQWRSIHGAIWNIMYGVPVADASMITQINAANAAAAAGFAGFAFSKWSVVTEQGAEGHGALDPYGAVADAFNQEYLVRTVVPEPATIILLGTGLLVTLVGFRRSFTGA